MSSTVADMQLFFMGLHENDHTYSCKNTDQLSSLWAAFTKCKRNIRDGFRLENMSWRLWYREAMIRKRLDTTSAIVLPESSTLTSTQSQTAQQHKYTNNNNDTIKNNNNNNKATRLVRTRSLPSLSLQSQHIIESCKRPSHPSSIINNPFSSSTTDFLALKKQYISTPTSAIAGAHPPIMPRTMKQSKFYIDQDDEGESDVESLFDDFDDDMESSCYSSDTTSIYPSFLEDDDQQQYDDDDVDDSMIQSACSNNKPISLLTSLLRKETTPSLGGLKRSHCYNRLDQWFNSALTSS